MPKIHWIGAGLSSGPGIRRLAQSGHNLLLWNRTLAKAKKILDGLDFSVAAYPLDWKTLSDSIVAGDVVVSMLPATMHPQVADLCLDRRAHLVITSYRSPEILERSEPALRSRLCIVTESGLDPGIDHLMAHALMNAYQKSVSFDRQNAHYFQSFCGGFPKIANDFRYKFSWSPLAVLRALKAPARWLAGGKVQHTDKVWESLTEYEALLPCGHERFQAYPNRDSTQYLAEYGFTDDWNVQEFIRGTLRLNGWSEAWKDIFTQVDSALGSEGERMLERISEELWAAYQYNAGEPDRVVLCVELEAWKDSETVWRQVYSLDEVGNERGTAMARLVSWTCSIAVESVLKNEIMPGVTAAPKELDRVNDWMGQLRSLGVRINHQEVLPARGGTR